MKNKKEIYHPLLASIARKKRKQYRFSSPCVCFTLHAKHLQDDNTRSKVNMGLWNQREYLPGWSTVWNKSVDGDKEDDEM